jgi:CDP-diacylglycerol--serine O-phosphatidyltransferase
LVYTFAIAVLMVSRLPVFSGKRVGKRVAPEMVLPVLVMVVVFFAVLIAFPWKVLTIGTLCYLASLPFGYLSYRRHKRKDAAAAASSAPAGADHARTHGEAPPLSPGHGEQPAERDRPTRH